MAVFDGRYGLYIKHGKTNAPFPKDREVDQIDLDEAVRLVNERAAQKGTKGGSTKGRSAKTKTAKSTKTTKSTKSAKSTKARKSASSTKKDSV